MRLFLAFLSVVILATSQLVAGTTPLAEQDAKAARKLYTSKCARCHKLYDPANYSDTEWRTWMDKMNRKAKLKPDQVELLSRYLDTFPRRDQHLTNAIPK
jgi:Dihaem cytochrome c